MLWCSSSSIASFFGLSARRAVPCQHQHKTAYRDERSSIDKSIVGRLITVDEKQGLLAAEDYLGALDIIQSAKSTVKNELGKLQGLKNVGR